MPEPLTVTEDQVRALRAALDALLPDERITQLTDERDRARRWAVGLEQENAELTRRLAEVPRTEQCGSGGFHGPHKWSVVAIWCPGRDTEQAAQ
ncbi:hypothetical protein ABZ874_24560 [Streptomyces albidoflavus]|uniref:hypothetical protein n=1 Tax=Streptomyces albidoflavus TaxID=1886 RepID=UPI0033CEDFA6